MAEKTLIERLEAKFIPEPNSGCWLWTGALHKGYGVFGIGPRDDHKTYQAHRVVYSLYRGDIPAGLDLDHLCRNRGCVNPDHLEPVTRQVNVARGDVPRLNRLRAVNRTACPSGHAYTPENTRRTATGARYCLACKRIKKAAFIERKRSANG